MFLFFTAPALANDPPSAAVVRQYLPDLVGAAPPGPSRFAFDYTTATPRGILFTNYDDFGDGPVPAGHFYEQLLPMQVSTDSGTIIAYVQEEADSDANTNGPTLGERRKFVDGGAYVPGVGIFEWRVGGDAPELVLPETFSAGTEWVSGKHRRFIVSTDVTARWVEGDGVWTAEHCLAIAEHPIPYAGSLDVEYRCRDGYGVVAAWRDAPERGERTVFFKARRMFWKETRREFPAAEALQQSIAGTVRSLPQRNPSTPPAQAPAPVTPAPGPLTASVSEFGAPPAATVTSQMAAAAPSGSDSPPSASQPGAGTGPKPAANPGGGVSTLFPGVNLHRGEVPWQGRELGDNGWGDTVYGAPFTLLGVPGGVVWSTCDAGPYGDEDPDATGLIVERLHWSVAYAPPGAGAPENDVVQSLPLPYQRGDETEQALRTANTIITGLHSQGWKDLGPLTHPPRPGADRDVTAQLAHGDERLTVTLAVVAGRSDATMRVGILELDVVTDTCPSF